MLHLLGFFHFILCTQVGTQNACYFVRCYNNICVINSKIPQRNFHEKPPPFVEGRVTPCGLTDGQTGVMKLKVAFSQIIGKARN